MKSNNQRRSNITAEDIIQEFKSIHADRYDYSHVVYKTMHTKVVIICPEHGMFTQTPNAHIRQAQDCPVCGDLKCAQGQRSNTKEFIVKAVTIHGGKYDYSKTKYGKNAHEPVTIICPEHGEFRIKPNKHLSEKSGCPTCGKRRMGWTKTSWRTSCEGKVAKLYIIHCQGNGESFYKIGITNKPDLKGRFTCKTLMPYSYDTVRIVEGDPDYIYDLEHILHRAHKSFRYRPLIHFEGETECFSQLTTCGL